jgi:hypothetical protein
MLADRLPTSVPIIPVRLGETAQAAQRDMPRLVCAEQLVDQEQGDVRNHSPSQPRRQAQP